VTGKVRRSDALTGLGLLLLAGLLTVASPARAEADLDGQPGTVAWRIPDLGIDGPLSGAAAPKVVTGDFTVGKGPGVADLGYYPSLSLEATADALVFSFSEGGCCQFVRRETFVGPVVVFPALPDDQDLQVEIGEGTIPITPADLLVTGNRLAIELSGRDISNGHFTLLVQPGSNLAERATLALIGAGLIALGTVRRRWLA
jgi:hypothetical protein